MAKAALEISSPDKKSALRYFPYVTFHMLLLIRYFPYVTLTGIGDSEKINVMKGKDFLLLHVSQKGIFPGSIRRGLGVLMRERMLRWSRNRPSDARLRLENSRREPKNVHFRPLFPERPSDALSLDTVGKDCDRARISKDGPSRYIPCIYATLGGIEISRVSKNVHFGPPRPHRTVAQATKDGQEPDRERTCVPPGGTAAKLKKCHIL